MQKMFREHGDFASMEVQIRKKHLKTKSETSGGAWFTEHRLKTEKQWTKMLAWSLVLLSLFWSLTRSKSTLWLYIMIHAIFSPQNLRKMIEKAWTWAQTHGRIRTNEIHGEQEIQVVVDEKFEVSNQDIEEFERSGSIAVEETLCNSFKI